MRAESCAKAESRNERRNKMKELSTERLYEIGKQIRQELMLRTLPVAIQFIEKADDFPPRLKFPHNDLDARLAPCQALHIVRTWGISVGMMYEDFLNMPCSVFYGLAERFDEELAKHWVEEMGFFKDIETAMKFIKSAPTIPAGDYVGFALSPLEWTRVKPDVVVVYGSSGQIGKLILSYIYTQGTGITTTFTGAAGLCSGGLFPALQDREVKVFIPGGGERGIAMTQDDELGMVIPSERLEDISEGLEAGKAGATRYPVRSYLHFTAVDHPYVKVIERIKKVEPKHKT